MTYVRSVAIKPRPGKILETTASLAKLRPAFDELDIVGAAFFQVVTGQNIGNIHVAYVAEDLESLGIAHDAITANQIYLDMLGEMPADISMGLIAQNIYRAGTVDMDRVALRTLTMGSPDFGKMGVATDWFSGLADELVKGGAQSSTVRVPIAGYSRPVISPATYYEDWSAWTAARESLAASEFAKVSQSNTESFGTPLGVQLTKKLPI